MLLQPIAHNGHRAAIGLAGVLIAAAALATSRTAPAAGPVEPAAAPTVRALAARIGESAGGTRFVLDLTGPASFSAQVLVRPPRLVIDIPDVTFKLGRGAPRRGAGLVKAFRYGLIAPRKSRVVLDLRRPVRVHRRFIFRHASGSYRLVIDLAPATGLANAARPPRAAPRRLHVTIAPRPAPAALQRHRSIRRGSPLVVIDPGHGGPDPGTTSAAGRREKKIVLDFALRLKAALKRAGVANVKLTRSSDLFVPLAKRAQFARRNGAALFLSVHADSIGRRKAAVTSGATLYTLSKRGSGAEARALAFRENASDIVAGFDAWENEPQVSAILISLLQKQTNRNSLALAGRLLASMKGRVPLNRRPLRTANFRVLRTQGIPAVLLELGYLSNRADAARLTSRRWQMATARTVACAIARHLGRARRRRRTCPK